jgi:cell division protein FtsB
VQWLLTSIEAKRAGYSRRCSGEDDMITNDGNSAADTEVGQKVRTVVGLVLLAVISYGLGLSHGRAEKSAGDYAELKAQYSALKAEYERDYEQYSAMKTRYDQTLAQYSALKAQYDRIEARTQKRP